MTINVHIVNKRHNAHVEQYVRNRVALVVGRFDKRLGNVDIHIRDENAERGGLDKSCSIDGHLIPRGSIHVSAKDNRVYAAIVKAIHRLEQAVAKAVDRGHQSLAIRHARGRLRNDNRRQSSEFPEDAQG